MRGWPPLAPRTTTNREGVPTRPVSPHPLAAEPAPTDAQSSRQVVALLPLVELAPVATELEQLSEVLEGLDRMTIGFNGFDDCTSIRARYGGGSSTWRRPKRMRGADARKAKNPTAASHPM